MANVEKLNDLSRPADLARLNQWIEEMVDDVTRVRKLVGLNRRTKEVLIEAAPGDGGGETNIYVNGVLVP